MVCHVFRKRGEDTSKKMITMQVQGEAQQRWLDNIREDMKEYRMTEDIELSKCMAYGDKGWPIAT